MLRTSRLVRFNEQHSKLRSKGEYVLMNSMKGHWNSWFPKGRALTTSSGQEQGRNVGGAGSRVSFWT